MSKKVKAPAPARGSKLTLSVGLVNVPVKVAPLVKSTSISGKRLCPCHHLPIKSSSTCTEDGTVVEAVTGFEQDGKYVVGVERSEHAVARDGQVDLASTVDVAALDPLYFDKSYLLWPQDGGEGAYDLLCEALRTSGKALIGQTVLSRSTRVLAIRWSDATGTLVVHSLAYDEAIAWSDVQLVRSATDARRDTVDEGQLALAQQLVSTLPEGVDLEAVADDYNESLRAAIEAAAMGLPAPEVAAAPAAAPVVDLMEALQASVAEAAPKPKAKRKKAAA